MKLISIIILCFSLQSFSMYEVKDLNQEKMKELYSFSGLDSFNFLELMNVFKHSGLSISSYYSLSIVDKFKLLDFSLSKIDHKKRYQFLKLILPQRDSIARFWKYNLNERCSAILFIDVALYMAPHVLKTEKKLAKDKKANYGKYSIGQSFLKHIKAEAKTKKKLSEVTPFYNCNFFASELDKIEKDVENRKTLSETEYEVKTIEQEVYEAVEENKRQGLD